MISQDFALPKHMVHHGQRPPSTDVTISNTAVDFRLAMHKCRYCVKHDDDNQPAGYAQQDRAVASVAPVLCCARFNRDNHSGFSMANCLIMRVTHKLETAQRGIFPRVHIWAVRSI